MTLALKEQEGEEDLCPVLAWAKAWKHREQGGSLGVGEEVTGKIPCECRSAAGPAPPMCLEAGPEPCPLFRYDDNPAPIPPSLCGSPHLGSGCSQGWPKPRINSGLFPAPMLYRRPWPNQLFTVRVKRSWTCRAGRARGPFWVGGMATMKVEI